MPAKGQSHPLADNGWTTNRKYSDEERRERKNKRQREFNKQLKQEAINMYGGRCISCGESRLALLTLDHIDDNGAEHRRETNTNGGTPFYQKMKKQGWPDGLQVLCFNCNCSKQITGKLPGKRRILHFTRRGPTWEPRPQT